MKPNMILAALVIGAALCSQSLAANVVRKTASTDGAAACGAAAAPTCNAPAAPTCNAPAPSCEAAGPSCAMVPSSAGLTPSCGGCGHCKECCKPLFSNLKDFFNCHFPCNQPLVIKPITCKHCCNNCGNCGCK